MKKQKKPKTQNKSKKMILCVIEKSIIKPLKENPIIKLSQKMQSFTKFNKAFIGFYNEIIGDFASKVKESLPEEYHAAIDEVMISNQKMIEGVKKVSKKLNTKTNKVKKPPSGWNLFYKNNLKSVDVTKQKEKMALVGKMWNAQSDEEKEEWNSKAKAAVAAVAAVATSDVSETEVVSDTEGGKEKKTAKKAPKEKKSPAKKKAPKKKKNSDVSDVSDASDKSDIDDEMPIIEAD